jgi:membrane-associated phospholipid phosphatase
VRLRPYEWFIVAYFSYVAAIAPILIPRGEERWLAAAVAGVVTAILFGLTRFFSILRDWAPIGCTLAAYREMNWFTPSIRDHHLERAWIVWDRWLLDDAHLRAAIESLGGLVPSVLEISYVLVYAIAPISLTILFLKSPIELHRRNVNIFWLAYLTGTLTAYALFPYFPSDPPRVVFEGMDLPTVVTVFRRFNLAILGKYGIHSSVFPSAHVAAAFSSAWGLLLAMPDRRRYGWMVAAYSLIVAIATIYGRYHYAADALAGFAISLLAFASALQPERRVLLTLI